MAVVKARVTFEYTATEDDELTLNIGDVVTNIQQLDGGWWEGELHGKHGVFPENFVEVIKEEPIPSPDKSTPLLPKARVTFDYKASEEDELDLVEGEIVEILDQEEEGWWQGIYKGKKGIFPSNFVEMIPFETEATDEKLVVLQNEVFDAGSDLRVLLDDSKSSTNATSHSALADEGDTKKTKPSGGMGFAISSADLFKAKLRPVSMVDGGKKSGSKNEEPKKPTQTVTPLPKTAPELSSKNRDPPDGGQTKRNAPAPPKEDALSKASDERYRVLFDYDPENSDELGLEKDDIVIVTNKDVCDGWWEGTCHGKKGVFPNNFVELCPPKTEEITKQLPRLPLVPPVSKAPALPARETKEEAKEASEPTPSQPPLGRRPVSTEQKKPLLPEVARPIPPSVSDQKKPLVPEPVRHVPQPATEQKKDLKTVPPPVSTEPRKPSLPESARPVVPEQKKPDVKKPPPPVTKNKPVPPRPTEKPLGEENSSGNSIKNKLNATLGAGISKFPSVGKKPVPQPNGFGRTFSQSLKRAVPKPTPEPEQKPTPKPEPKPTPEPELKLVPSKPEVEERYDDVSSEKDKEGQGVDWEAPSVTPVLSNVNKNRVKGPGKALPAKYTQNKEQQNGVTEQPPWKTELAQKEKSKPTQLVKVPTPDSTSERDKAPSKEQATKPTYDDDVIEGMKNQLNQVMDKMTGMEKKLMKHIEVLTNDLDEERKLRANLQIEVDRLKKKVSVLQNQ
ncbi:CD2-associated protein-like [Rhopilema esculentum]|uniref:CD2-associated protein-like n=1 Tax=Rhopilema esculentum TaxID=499914 RepID=UPI0031E32664